MFIQLPLQPSFDTLGCFLTVRKKKAFIELEIPDKIPHAENVTRRNLYVRQVCIAFGTVRIAPLIAEGIIK